MQLKALYGKVFRTAVELLDNPTSEKLRGRLAENKTEWDGVWLLRYAMEISDANFNGGRSYLKKIMVIPLYLNMDLI